MKAILIVDDEPHISRVTRHCLEQAGYEVEIAPDGREALERLEWREFDAVVTDIMMPRMSGKELCLAIRERWPDRRLPIFVITSSIEQEHREWASLIADSEFLEKPVSMRILTRRLADVLSGNDKPEAAS
jgi:DNA-binding response OmpR family regulator